MLTAHLLWRAKNGIPGVLEDPSTTVTDLFPHSFHKFDREGRPVFYQRLGGFDCVGLVRHMGHDGLVRRHIRCMEASEIMMRRAMPEGANPTPITFITDMTGLGISHLHKGALAALEVMLKDDAEHYPESVNVVLVINCPKIFEVIWAIVKPWVDANTLAKLTIVPTSKTAEAVAAIIDPIDIPDWIPGGRCHCSPSCVIDGGMVDASAQFQVAKIGARSSFTHTVTVPIGHRIIWSYYTDAYDIGFGVKFVGETEQVEVEPNSRSEASVESISGQLVAEREGPYQLTWDNTFSLLRSKTLHFSVAVLSPDEQFYTA
jgi:hypothetical protein